MLFSSTPLFYAVVALELYRQRLVGASGRVFCFVLRLLSVCVYVYMYVCMYVKAGACVQFMLDKANTVLWRTMIPFYWVCTLMPSFCCEKQKTKTRVA